MFDLLMMMHVVGGVSVGGAGGAGEAGGGYTSLSNMVTLMDMRKTEMGGRRVGNEECETKQAAVFNTHLRNHIDHI